MVFDYEAEAENLLEGLYLVPKVNNIDILSLSLASQVLVSK